VRSGVVDLDHPANAAVLRRLMGREGGRGVAPDLAPEEVADHSTLGTHPDTVHHFWNVITEGLTDAERCRRIVYQSPALVSPASGVIFGFAGGTFAYALRLPPGQRDRALAAGGARVEHYRAYPEIGIAASTDDLATVGDEWVFCHQARYERLWCRYARDYADQV
jgi:hypothetical protein